MNDSYSEQGIDRSVRGIEQEAKVQAPPILQELNALDAALQRLDKTTHMIAEKLEPLRSVQPPNANATSAQSERSGSSNIVSTLGEFRDRVNLMDDRMRSMCRGLEI